MADSAPAASRVHAILLDGLRQRFTFPRAAGIPQLVEVAAIYDEGYDLAHKFVLSTEPGRSQALALTKLEEACFWAARACLEKS